MYLAPDSQCSGRQLRDSHRELEQAKDRIAKLDSIIQRLYEDNIDGKISDECFSRMSATYEEEQKQLESRSTELQQFIDTSKEQRLNVDSFLSLVRRYTDITELTAENKQEKRHSLHLRKLCRFLFGLKIPN